jgi:hypothetical protein
MDSVRGRVDQDYGHAGRRHTGPLTAFAMPCPPGRTTASSPSTASHQLSSPSLCTPLCSLFIASTSSIGCPSSRPLSTLPATLSSFSSPCPLSSSSRHARHPPRYRPRSVSRSHRHEGAAPLQRGSHPLIPAGLRHPGEDRVGWGGGRQPAAGHAVCFLPFACCSVGHPSSQPFYHPSL